MTYQARLRGRSVQVLRPSKGGTGPRRWQTLIRVPVGATRRNLRPIVGKSQTGVEYVWMAAGRKFKVRIHDPDPSVKPTPANPRPNALAGWIVRVSRGHEYMDPYGNYHPPRRVKPGGPYFDEVIANETHIPIVIPIVYP